MTMKSTIFCEVTTCSLVEEERTVSNFEYNYAG
jgi:hypothetical protein